MIRHMAYQMGDPQGMFKMWTESQQRLMEQWLGGMRAPPAAGAPGAEAWTRLLDTWESAVRQSLDAQAQWRQQFLAPLLDGKALPDQLRPLVQQGQAQMEIWAASQRQLWDSWFAMARKLAASQAGGMAMPGQDLMQAWQDTVRSTLEAQAGAMRQWADAASAGQGTEQRHRS
jgi:hypothetical protein